MKLYKLIPSSTINHTINSDIQYSVLSSEADMAYYN